MKVLFVVNCAYIKGNGLSASARTTMAYLKEAGVDVRVLSMRNPDPDGPQPDYPMEPYHIYGFQWIIDAQGYAYASSNNKIVTEAVSWADVVHLEEAFVLEWRTANIARKLGKPCVATYHLHPENIFCSVGLGHVRWLNETLQYMFRKLVFDKCSDIQCPTQNVYDRLKSSGFKADLHVISNGMKIKEIGQPSDPQTDPYLITCIGRLSNEKDQYTLMRAMRHSRYRDRIQLYFAGQGPRQKDMMKKAHRLYTDGVVKYDPVFAFHTLDELSALAHRAYLTIHCAEFEVEGLSILEALREGAVPVIAEGPCTATSQFALDNRSIYPVRDEKALARKIDWWIEHPEERAKISPEYARSVERYDIHSSIEKLVAMYGNAISKFAK